MTTVARALYLAPFAVPRQVRALVPDLGAELSIREGRNVKRTPAAQLAPRQATDLAVIVPNANSPTWDDQSSLLDEAALENWIVPEPTGTDRHALALSGCTAAGFRPRSRTTPPTRTAFSFSSRPVTASTSCPGS